MADESLVSTVYFRGNNVGVRSLVVQDTSIRPSLTFTAPNLSGNTFNIVKDVQTNLTITMNPYIPQFNTLYFKLTLDDAYKYRATSANGTVVGATGSGSIPMTSQSNGTGTGWLNIDLIFYPSAALTIARLEVFIDAAMTDRVGLMNLENRAATNVNLRLTSLRNMANASDVNPTGIYNNDYLAVKYTDAATNYNYTTNVPFTLYIADRKLDPGFYNESSDSWIAGLLAPGMNIGYGSAEPVSVARQRNPYVRGNVSCSVVCGDWSASNTCMDSSFFGDATVRLVRGRSGQAVGAGITNLDTGATSPENFGNDTIIQSFMDLGSFYISLRGLQSHLSNATRRDSLFIKFLSQQANLNSEDWSTTKPDTVYLTIGGQKFQMTANRRTNTNTERRNADQVYILANTGQHNDFYNVFNSLVGQTIKVSVTLS